MYSNDTDVCKNNDTEEETPLGDCRPNALIKHGCVSDVPERLPTQLSGLYSMPNHFGIRLLPALKAILRYSRSITLNRGKSRAVWTWIKGVKKLSRNSVLRTRPA